MRAKRGYREHKMDSPHIGNWFKRYFVKRTCRRWQYRANNAEERSRANG